MERIVAAYRWVCLVGMLWFQGWVVASLWIREGQEPMLFGVLGRTCFEGMVVLSVLGPILLIAGWRTSGERQMEFTRLNTANALAGMLAIVWGFAAGFVVESLDSPYAPPGVPILIAIGLMAVADLVFVVYSCARIRAWSLTTDTEDSI